MAKLFSQITLETTKGHPHLFLPNPLPTLCCGRNSKHNRMKRLSLLLIFGLIGFNVSAQVGINNISPNASLDITASNQASPASNDGLLIPRIDAFPATDPTAAQHGMMVYLTTTDAGNPPGFYFWNQATTSWDSISGNGAEQINELTDGISDGTSLFLGANSGQNDDGGNSNVGVGLFSLSNNSSGNSNTAVGSSSMINNTSGSGNSAFGRQSLPLNTSGNDNTMIGFQAGLSNTTGFQNTAVGAAALDANTTGYDNTAIGYSVMGSNNTGRLNTAIGTSALLSNTEGFENTAVGVGALRNNTTGDYNIALGSGALSGAVSSSYNIGIGRNTMSNIFSNPAAQYNVALGDVALSSLTSGSRNIAIGGSALTTLSSGIGNVGIGMETMTTATTAQYNTAVGFNAGRNVLDGDFNVFMGYQSGENNTRGTDNVFLGANTGFNNTVGNNNVFIGYNTGYFETGSNKLYIDNSNSTTPLIWGDFNVNVLRVNGAFQVGNPTGTGYEFPATDGTLGEVLRTDGAGNISWGNIADDADWYQEGTTTAPSTSSDDIFTDGNVGIGTSTVNYPLDIDATSTRTIDLENTGNGFIYGLYNRINEAAPSASVTNTYGILNSITRTNQSLISGVSNSFSNSVSTASFGYLFGVDNSFGTSTSSLSIGFFNRFQGTTTTAVGMRNLVAGSFTDFYGVQNYNLTGGHNGTFYGLYNFFGASGGNGTRYGAFTEFFDTGIGNKYGYYVDIADSAGGTHYGIYSSALKSGSYAGYFLGDVAIGTTTANNYTFPASRGTNGQVMVTDAAGNLSWTTLSGLESTTASNGITETGDDVRLGGALNQNTTITTGINNLIFNLSATGYFEVQDAGTAKFRISNTGNTRLGGSLQVNQTNVTGTRLIELTSAGSTGLINAYAAGINTVQIAGTGDSYINGGSFGLGITNPQEQLDVVDNTAGYVGDFYNESTDSTADGISVRLAASSPNASAYYIGFFRGSGATVSGRISGTAAGTGIQVVTSSDARLKTNLEEVTDALSMIQEINPKWYEFKTNLGQRELGFIAQEVKTVLPQIVTGEEDSDPRVDPMMVDYARITPLLTAGIKELHAKVNALEAENEALKAQLAAFRALEARISALEQSGDSPKNVAANE